ncbi:hybrid sensor histidine kinase/response regulator [Synechocystis sp. PCC 7509]|uniref:hybrid sensor histidine kinase/response regulator n=1 Tax=Synechocystis sp. PCC 7509 TaxID=927677 RepID=UPI0002ACC906|nr:PAS domain S-box protein [Synechocystis sp. PCC 7509]
MNLRVLIIEDAEDDMLLMLRELGRGDYTLEYVRVDTAAAMEAAIACQTWDIAIADYTLPTFSAPEALKLLQSRGLDIPFIIVSGTIGEETAVAAMKAGAHDYIIKGNLTRLLPAVERELREAKERHLRRCAEQALRESEEQVRLQANALAVANQVLRDYTQELEELYNQAPCGYHSLDKNGVFVRINDTELKMLGYSRDQIVGKKFADLLTEESQQVFWENFSLFQQRGWVRDLEFQMLRADGTILPVSLSATAMIDSTGSYLMNRSVVIDVSDRALAEDNLKRSEQKFRAIFDSTFQLMGLLTTEGIVVEANRTALEVVGVEIKDVVGQPFWLTPWWTGSQQVQVQRAIFTAAGGELVRFESQHIWADGTKAYVDFSIKPVFDHEGKVVMLIPEGRDISDRLQAEAKIREQAALLDITTDAIFVRDLDHRILFWNKGAERLYGWESEAVLGKNAIQLLYKPGETLPQFAAMQKILFQEGQWQGELQNVTSSGKTVVIESRWTLVYDESGNHKSILTVSTDITEKKQLEAQLMRVQRLESLGTLASGIAHDFNNILTPILAAVQLLPLKIKGLDDQTRGLLTLIEDSTKRGAGLVKQILAFARGAEAKRVPLQAKHILAEVIQVARQTFPKNIKLCSDSSSPNLWTVAADANQLHQVLLNLCVNARDAMLNGGTLSLAIENQVVDSAYARMNVEACIGCYVMITVADTGTGIMPELMERIFDPFFTTKEPGKGTGLGLSTVLGIVKNHSGFINVYSEVGKGTQFRVYLPAIAETVSSQVTELELLSGQQELILIVDDEPLIQQVIQTTLETYNYRAIVASDGFEAIAMYVEYVNQISVVLMDIMMPSMDGLTAIARLQELNPQVRVIATSGLASNSQLAENVGTGVKAFLPKPYTAKELLDTLQKVLSNG